MQTLNAYRSRRLVVRLVARAIAPRSAVVLECENDEKQRVFSPYLSLLWNALKNRYIKCK